MTGILLAATVRSARNALRDDGAIRASLVVAVAAACAAGWWSSAWLSAAVSARDNLVQLAATDRLGLLVTGAWAALAGLGWVGSRHYAFAVDEARLLMTLAIPPATRFRALYGRVLFEGAGGVALLCSVVVLATVGLTAAGLLWTTVLLAGACWVVCAALVGQWLLIRRQWWSLGALVLVTLAGGVCGVLWPLAGVVVLGLLPAAVCGPLAARAGRLYIAAYVDRMGVTQRVAGWTPPGVGLILGVLQRRRSPTAALLARSVVQRTRSPLVWLRAAVVVGMVGLFPRVHDAVIGMGATSLLALLGYAAGIGVLSVADTDPSPIGSEGSRMAWWLTAPIKSTTLLRTRLKATLLPALVLASAAAVAGGLLAQLPVATIMAATGLAMLVTVGPTTALTLGSAWEVDLRAPVEDAEHAFVLEEVPATPFRLGLLGLVLLLTAAGIALMWQVPSPFGPALLAVFEAAVVMLAWGTGVAALQRGH